MNLMSQLWITKYRPKTLDEIVLPEHVKNQIRQWIQSGHVPNLLLIGQPGTGKTSLANVIKENMNVEMLTLNGSEERGIETIRNKVQNFAMAGSDRLKIVFFDEADGLTPDAQQSLRRIIEEYADNTRFIFTANYDKFIQPLKDRFTIIHFDRLTKDDIKKIVLRILENENVEYNIEDVMKVIDMLYPSLRSIIQTLQTNTKEENGKRKLFVVNIVKSNDLELQQEILHNFFVEGNIDKIRQIITDNNITDFTSLYRLFFDNVKESYEKLIIAEFEYRNSFASDKEINFIGMLYALKLKALPFMLVNLSELTMNNKKENVIYDTKSENKNKQQIVETKKEETSTNIGHEIINSNDNDNDDPLLELDNLIS